MANHDGIASRHLQTVKNKHLPDADDVSHLVRDDTQQRSIVFHLYDVGAVEILQHQRRAKHAQGERVSRTYRCTVVDRFVCTAGSRKV